METQEQLNKIIDLYENSNGVCVFRNKIVCETDHTLIWLNDKTLYFQFDEDDIEDFKVKLEEISEIKFDEVVSMTISIIKLTNGDKILIHNL